MPIPLRWHKPTFPNQPSGPAPGTEYVLFPGFLPGVIEKFDPFWVINSPQVQMDFLLIYDSILSPENIPLKLFPLNSSVEHLTDGSREVRNMVGERSRAIKLPIQQPPSGQPDNATISQAQWTGR